MNKQLNVIDLQNGDEYTFRRIFHLFNNRLCFLARTMLPDTPDMDEDIVQEAFIKLWERKEHFHNIDAVKGFLYLTVKNKCRDIYKHEKVVNRHKNSCKAMTEEQLDMQYIMEAEVLEEVRRALEKLPAGSRNVLDLSYFKGLKNEEVARKLDISVNTVKTHKLRGLRSLRSLLKGILSAAGLL
jgi:RNA polymerase sigma-70 factor (family 1)